MDKIGIAGIGGIGSNIAQTLVRCGVKQIKIVDFDMVESSNLNRQFFFAHQVEKLKTHMLENNLKQIYPAIEIEALNVKITPKNIQELFSDCSIIVEGLDSKESKKILFEAFAQSKKLVVSANGIAGYDMDNIKIKILGNCAIVGDFTSDENLEDLFPPKVQMVAAIMAGLVLKKLNLT